MRVVAIDARHHVLFNPVSVGLTELARFADVAAGAKLIDGGLTTFHKTIRLSSMYGMALLAIHGAMCVAALDSAYGRVLILMTGEADIICFYSG